MTITQECPVEVEAPTDEPTCRHGYYIDHSSPDLPVGGRADMLTEAHRLLCPRPAVFWHPRWPWMDLPVIERIGMVVCCAGCREQVAP